MSKIKLILKAFVLIALIPIFAIGGILAVVPVAQMCMGGISHPLMAFPALIMMLPWGLFFIMIFFYQENKLICTEKQFPMFSSV